MMLKNSYEAPKEDKPSDTIVSTEKKKDRVLICHKCHKENHFSWDFKVNVVKDKAFYLRMTQEVEDKEKATAKAFVAQVRRDHQMWSSVDEDMKLITRGSEVICLSLQ